MADDEVETPPDPQRSGGATPNRGKRREPPVIDGAATEIPSAEHEGPVMAEPLADVDEVVHDGAESAVDHTPEGGAPETTFEPHPAPEPQGMPGQEPPAASETPSQPNPSARRSNLPMLLSVLGALIVLLLGGVLYALYNPPPNDAVTALTAQVNDLKQRMATIETRQPVDLKPLESRVAALEGKTSDTAPDLKPVEDRVAAVEATTQQLKSDLADLQGKLGQTPAAANGAAAPGPDLGAVDKQMADLQAGQKSLQDALAAVPKIDIAPLQKQVGDLGGGVKSLQDKVAALPKTDLDPLSNRVDDIGQKVAGVVTAVAALPHIDLAPVYQKIDGLDHRLSPIEAELSEAKSNTQVTEARQNGSGAETRGAPLAVTGQAVLQAIADGRPFAPEVKTLQALGADPKLLEPLQSVADKGAPSQADLLAGFQANEGKMVGTAAPKPGGSVLDRMMAGAQNLVKVRPEGASPGQDPDAVVSRIGDDIEHGAYGSALSEWNGLPEDGRNATQGWAAQVKARADAEDAAHAVVAQAIAAIGARP